MTEPIASHPPLVLIANDQEWSARSLESILSPNGFAVLRAHNGRQVVQRARASRPDVLIVDADLPDIGGIELCRTLRGDAGVSPSTPILITTAGPTNRQQRLDALKAGAWDFLGLPLDAEELVLKLSSYVQAKFDADTARDESLLDSATGFYNLRGLLQRARELGADASRHDRPMACVVFATEPAEDGDDADRDGEIPAAAGHMARILKAAGRGSDAIGRLGQAEFVVLAPGTDADGALLLARRLVAAVDAAPVTVAGPPLEPTAPLDLRAGYCAVPNLRTAAIDPVDLLVRATMALRKSQADPGDERIRFFSFEPDPPSSLS